MHQRIKYSQGWGPPCSPLPPLRLSDAFVSPGPSEGELGPIWFHPPRLRQWSRGPVASLFLEPALGLRPAPPPRLPPGGYHWACGRRWRSPPGSTSGCPRILHPSGTPPCSSGPAPARGIRPFYCFLCLGAEAEDGQWGTGAPVPEEAHLRLRGPQSQTSRNSQSPALSASPLQPQRTPLPGQGPRHLGGQELPNPWPQSPLFLGGRPPEFHLRSAASLGVTDV